MMEMLTWAYPPLWQPARLSRRQSRLGVYILRAERWIAAADYSGTSLAGEVVGEVPKEGLPCQLDSAWVWSYPQAGYEFCPLKVEINQLKGNSVSKTILILQRNRDSLFRLWNSPVPRMQEGAQRGQRQAARPNTQPLGITAPPRHFPSHSLGCLPVPERAQQDWDGCCLTAASPATSTSLPALAVQLTVRLHGRGLLSGSPGWCQPPPCNPALLH